MGFWLGMGDLSGLNFFFFSIHSCCVWLTKVDIVMGGASLGFRV